MYPLPFLRDFLVILAAAVLVIFVSRPLRLPSVVGFLLTGLLIGPTGLDFIHDRQQIEVFAELGVVMLLFFVGLEFSLAHLRAISRQFLGGGSLQVTLTILLTVALFAFSGFSVNTAVFLGCLIALSSTAIVLKTLADRSELGTPHGRLSVGILLFQDFCIVPMIVLTPLFAGHHGVSLTDIVLRFLLSTLAIVAIFFLARFLMPRALHQIARTGVREAFLMGSLLVCLLAAATTASLGFSYALGAFIAGLIVSESEYSHEVVAEIASFRDLFASLFFISIGMLLDLKLVAQEPLPVLAIGSGIFLLKACVVLAVAWTLRSPLRSSIIAAVSLAQIGEFSFVLAKVGQTAGLLDDVLYQHFLSASIFTMLLSPPLIAFAPSFAERTQNLLPFLKFGFEPLGQPGEHLVDHVIVVGYGVNGQNVARVLQETGIPYVIIESNADLVKDLRRGGHPIVFGDVTRKEILRQCRVQQARLIVFAISDPRGTRAGVRVARSMNPRVYILVRTRLVSEVEELEKLGANEVIPEEFETSIEIFTRVLDQYHIPRNVINAQIKVIRDENYSMLRGLPQTSRGLERMTQLLAAGTSDIFLVTSDSIAAGKTLLELDLRAKTGANLIAVVRGDKPCISPSPDFRIESADTLVLVGTHASIDKAFDFLATPAAGDDPDIKNFEEGRETKQ
jgi:CPA2 family monovalent cation:H+ antiporter-2